jgi:hypothetical protein
MRTACRAEDVSVHKAQGQQPDQRNEDEDERASARVQQTSLLQSGLMARVRIGRLPLAGVGANPDRQSHRHKQDGQ